MKHTLGQWEFNVSDWTIRVKEWGNNDLMADYKGCIIADLNNSHGDRKHAFNEVKANAELIAAAPELLEACIRIDRETTANMPPTLSAVEQVRKAIAKALGENTK